MLALTAAQDRGFSENLLKYFPFAYVDCIYQAGPLPDVGVKKPDRTPQVVVIVPSRYSQAMLNYSEVPLYLLGPITTICVVGADSGPLQLVGAGSVDVDLDTVKLLIFAKPKDTQSG